MRVRQGGTLVGMTVEVGTVAVGAVSVGAAAPDFELKDQHGTPVRLSSFRGSKNVVLVFYPLAFSGVCGGELCALRDSFPEVSQRPDAELLTVSVDSTFALRAWADAEGFSFGMLSDFWPHGSVASAYGVFDAERGIAVRGTFIIDTSGVVRWKVVNPIPQARDVADYAKALAALLPCRVIAAGYGRPTRRAGRAPGGAVCCGITWCWSARRASWLATGRRISTAVRGAVACT
jgi:mycoredoxin-dependent peroxiredoxin